MLPSGAVEDPDGVAATEAPIWFTLSGDDVAQRLGVDPDRGLDRRGGGEAAPAVRAEQVRGGQGRAALAGVPSGSTRIRCRSSSWRPASEPLPDQGVRHRDPDHLPHALQRRPRATPGGEGSGGRRGTAEDDDRQGARAPGREPGRATGRAARPRRRRLARSRRRRPRRRPPAFERFARDRRVGADRRERAGLERRRDGRERRCAARGPDGHGLHEHECDQGLGRVRRHRHRHADRGGPHLGPPPTPGGREDAPHPPAGNADQADPLPRRLRVWWPRSRSTCGAVTSSRASSPRRSRSPSPPSPPASRPSSRRSSRTARRCSRRRTRS